MVTLGAPSAWVRPEAGTWGYRTANLEVVIAGYFMAAALAGLSVSQGVSMPLTRKVLTGFTSITEKLSEQQKNIVHILEACRAGFVDQNPDIAKAITQPDIDFWEGTYLTQNVLEAMRQTGATRIFYTSGSGVYGEDPAVDFPEDYGPCIPISTYGASKLASESIIAAYCHMFGLVARVFRFANVVGPRQTHGVGYDFIRRLKNDSTALRILGDGAQTKSYIHVDDVLEAIFFVEANAIERYEVFNVATDDYITVRQIADLAVAIVGLRPEDVRYDFAGGDRGWKGDVPIVRLDCSKIKNLGWKSRRSSTGPTPRRCGSSDGSSRCIGPSPRSWSRTTNSSPPNRATVSVARIRAVMRRATS
jgi:UDP-glucose 4-epimerase